MAHRCACCALVFMLALVASACSPVRYGLDYDREVEFTKLSTFGLMLPNAEEREALSLVSPFLERRLERALRDEMEARGYEESLDGQPDFWIAAYPVLPPLESADGPTTSTFPAPARPPVNVSVGFSVGTPFLPGMWGFPYHTAFRPYGGSHFGYGFGAPTFGFGVQSFGGYGPVGIPSRGTAAPGTIVIDVTDGRTEELVWQGWAEDGLQDAPSGDSLSEYVGYLVERILEGFPPRRAEAKATLDPGTW